MALYEPSQNLVEVDPSANLWEDFIEVEVNPHEIITVVSNKPPPEGGTTRVINVEVVALPEVETPNPAQTGSGVYERVSGEEEVEVIVTASMGNSGRGKKSYPKATPE